MLGLQIVIISNGLGNQMSQFAFYLQKKELGQNVVWIPNKKSRNDHNGFELERIFNLRYNHKISHDFLLFIYRLLGSKKYPLISNSIIFVFNLFKIKLIQESYNYNFNKEFLSENKGFLTFYEGGWHSPKYFHSIREQIKSIYNFKIPSSDLSNKLKEIDIQNANSVSLHIRRGDYINETNWNTFGKVCDLDYYKSAVSYIKSCVIEPVFFVFTNDITWVRENLNSIDYKIVSLNTEKDSWKDMYLMSQCKHHINANSTFSWWGAWLNDSIDKITIVPQEFISGKEFVDVYPDNWIKIPAKR